MSEMATSPIPALMLDDERKSIDTAKENFSKVNILIEPSLKIEDFEKKGKDYNLIFSDLNLKNISKSDDGIKMLIKTRAKNKTAFLVLYSSFLSELKKEQFDLLKENDIQYYDKKDRVAIQNIRMDYENFVNSKKINESREICDKNKLMEKHYLATKNMALNHLKHISGGNILVPLVKAKKLFTIDEMISQVESDSEIGSQFIFQYLDTLALINSKKPKT